MRKKLIPFILMLFILSCTETYKLDEFSDCSGKMTVNSLFTSDSVFKVYIFRTVCFSETMIDTIIGIDDAVCSLFVDNSFLETLQPAGKGIYISPDNFKPQAGHFYKIKIKHPLYGEVSAESFLPAKPNLLSAERKDSSYFLFEDGSNLFLPTVFISFEKTNNKFYEIAFKQYSCYYINGRFKQNWNFYTNLIFSDNTKINQWTNNFYSLTFTDSLLSATNKVEIVYFPKKTFYPDSSYDIYVSESLGEFKNLRIYLRSVSKEYFSFKKSVYQYYLNEPTVFTGNAYPANIFSNVKNGYGIFAGYNQIVDSTTFPITLDSVLIKILKQ